MELTKENVVVSVGSIERGGKIEDFEKKFKAIKKKAIKDGCTNITVALEYREKGAGDDDYNSSWISIEGTRLETDEEWHKRLVLECGRLCRCIKDIERIPTDLTYYKKEIEKLNEAIETSPLRCEKCNVPVYWVTYTGNKHKRLCNKCNNV